PGIASACARYSSDGADAKAHHVRTRTQMESAMRAVPGSLSIVFLSSTLLFAQENPASSQRPLAFTHVTIVDATGSPAQPDMTVLVSGNRITALGKFGTVAIPPDALVTNAQSKF